jgi:hypothetical protein
MYAAAHVFMTVLELGWRDWGKPWTSQVIIAGTHVEIRTGIYPNTGLDCYWYSNLIRKKST